MAKKKIDVNYNASKENIVINPRGVHNPDSVKGIEELTNDEFKLSIHAMENLDPVIWIKQSDITKLHQMVKTKDAELEVVRLERDIAVKSNDVSLSELTELKKEKTDLLSMFGVTEIKQVKDLLMGKIYKIDSFQRIDEDQKKYIKMLEDENRSLVNRKEAIETGFKAYKDLLLTALKG